MSLPGGVRLIAASEERTDREGHWVQHTIRTSVKDESGSPALMVLLSGQAWVSSLGTGSSAPLGLLPGSAVVLQQGVDIAWGVQCSQDLAVWALWLWPSRVPLSLKVQAAVSQEGQTHPARKAKIVKSEIPGKDVWKALWSERLWLTNVAVNPLLARVLASLIEYGLMVVAGSMDWASHSDTRQAYMTATAINAALSLLRQVPAKLLHPCSPTWWQTIPLSIWKVLSGSQQFCCFPTTHPSKTTPYFFHTRLL